MTTGRVFHEVAGLFPPMSGDELEQLIADIRAHGQREPIWLHPNGQVIDGRHRYMACRRLGLEPKTRTWDGKGDLVAFVVSLNLRRRHLDESQRAMVAARVATLKRGTNQHSSIELSSATQAQAAELMSVGVASVKRAREVLDKGAPELVAAVEQGRVAVSTAAEIAEAPREEQREIVAKGEREILAAAKEIRTRKLEERRTERMEKLAAISAGNAELDGSVGRFPVIYADPPWRYEHIETESRAVENQYPTMSLDDICAMRLGDVTTDDAVLFLWATSPKLAEAMRVVESWGFVYRTCLVWDKERIGMGYYARQQHELLLVATKGHPPAPAPDARPASVVRVRRPEEHSAKPPEFYEIIERMYPALPKLELFCRSPRKGWVAWGNQSVAA